MERWHLKRVEYPNVTKLAELIHSIPCTQVSVKRSFSRLKFLLSDYRSNIDSKCLKNVFVNSVFFNSFQTLLNFIIKNNLRLNFNN